jgi:hypothetical protein
MRTTMRTNLVCAAFTILTSSVSMAAKFQCGLWLDDNNDPSTTFAYDSSDEQAVEAAGDFTAIVQKQDSGAFVAAVFRSDKTLSAALYPATTSILTSHLQTSDGKSGTLQCNLSGVKLVRPQLKL